MTPGALPYAGIASRAVALALDALLAQIIVLTGGAVLALVASLVGDAQLSTTGTYLAGLVWIGFVGLYFVVFWSTAGQTPGMRVMALRVITRSGRHPGVGRSIVRVIGLGLAIIPLFAGFIPVLFDSRRRALQDMLAGTVVIYAGAEPPGVPASPEAHQTASLRPPAPQPRIGGDPRPRGGAQT
jgi:uncharacterized RDD family membrane protein YckC